MAEMSFTWTVMGVGSADCVIADNQSEARVRVSYISTAPESFLHGVTRLVLGARHIKIHFEGEPVSRRWIFDRYGEYVDIQILRLDHGQLPDSEGRIAWESRRQTVQALARAVIKGFDHLADDPGEARYLKEWTHPFPRQELEDLRTALDSVLPSETTPAENEQNQPPNL